MTCVTNIPFSLVIKPLTCVATVDLQQLSVYSGCLCVLQHVISAFFNYQIKQLKVGKMY